MQAGGIASRQSEGPTKPLRRRALSAMLATVLATPMLAFLGASPASAATLTFNPDADSKVQQANATTNYGTSPTLKVDGGTDPVIESYLKFTVAGASTAVTNAKLRVFTSTNTSNGPAVYAASNSWTETGVNYNNRPARTSAASDDKGAVASGVWVEFDVAPLVSGNGTYTFDMATNSTDGMTFSSREGTSKPELVVTTATNADGQPPTVPGNVTASANSPYKVTVSWDQSSDNVAVTGYDVYRNGSLLNGVGTNVQQYADTSANPDADYAYQVLARDGAGNTSALSDITPASSVHTPTDAPPPVPQNLQVTSVTAREVDLKWDASIDDVGTTNYKIYRGTGTDQPTVIDTVGAVTTYQDKSVQPITDYTYEVEAIDTANQPSGPSDPVSATTPIVPVDLKPTAPANVRANATSPYRIVVAWDPSIDDNGIQSYNVYRDGGTVAIGTVDGATTSYADTSVNPGFPYQYQVEAVDTAGQSSGLSASASATTPTDQFPSAPGNVKATAFSSTRVDVTWDAAIDDVGVTGYNVYRGGTLLHTVGNVTSYSDTSARPGQNYSYTVQAIDTANQTSGQSAPASVTTPDQAPSVPTNLKGTAVSSTRVDLTWNASADDVGVTGYNVYRDGTVIKTVGAVTSYSDTTAKAGIRYTYQVEAIDTANQGSGPSAAAVVTTPSGADPVIAAAGDIACASLTQTSSACHQLATSNLLTDVNAVLPLGDEQYDNATLSEFQSYYDKSWGRFAFMTFPTVGNHEYYVSSTAAGYFDYFGAKAGPRPQGYYSYNLGAWHLISLNANCSKIGGCDTSSAEYKWLQTDLAANPTTCTLAYWHQPLFGTNGGTSSVKPLWQTLYAAHADIVLNGHEHHYERFAPQTPTGSANAAGIREFVVGTGGKSLGGFGSTTPSATSQVRNSNTFGVLKLTLHATSYDWRFVPEAGKTFTDSGTSNCV